MIQHVYLKNFKSHKKSKVTLGNLTVLSGQNGVGKSSIIQSLLLLRQTHLKGRLNAVLDLNSPLCFIGKTRDALYQYPDKEEKIAIKIAISDISGKNFSWTFDTSEESTFLNRINPIEESGGFEDLALFKNNFQFISAARSALYETDDYEVKIQKQLSIKEGKAELTAQFLYHFSKLLKVLPELQHDKESDPYLGSQSSAWEREISNGVNVYPDNYGDGYGIRYSFFNETLGETDKYNSKNVGFGLSYALPIIVAILSAEPGTLLLIENPEAHLHPYGQSKMAELIALAAQAGIQILVETHSDHIINGILIQCKTFEQTEKGLDKANLKMYSITRDEIEHKSIMTPVEVGIGGSLLDRPITFFDQNGKDVRILMR